MKKMLLEVCKCHQTYIICFGPYKNELLTFEGKQTFSFYPINWCLTSGDKLFLYYEEEINCFVMKLFKKNFLSTMVVMIRLATRWFQDPILIFNLNFFISLNFKVY